MSLLSLSPSSDWCYAAVLKVVSFGVMIASTELLALSKEWSYQGLYSWQVTRTRFPGAIRNGSIVVFDAFCSYRPYMTLVAFQFFCGLSLFMGILPVYNMLFLYGILFVHLLTMLQQHGTDGADQMMTIVLVSLILFYCTPDPLVKRAATWFLALQVILSYFTAGLIKLWSPEWLQGSILKKSLALGLGSETLCKWLPDNKLLNQGLCLSVVAYECIFPAVIFLSPGVRIGFLLMGVLLHVTNAIAFGLPRFIFTFAAAYPVVFYFCTDIRMMFWARA